MPKPLWGPDDVDRCVLCVPDEGFVVHRGERAFVLLNRFPLLIPDALADTAERLRPRFTA